MITLEILLATRKIVDEHETFICFAADEAGRETGDRVAARALRDFISREVGGPLHLLEDWVAPRLGTHIRIFFRHPTWGRQMRLAWLDKLIADAETIA